MLDAAASHAQDQPQAERKPLFLVEVAEGADGNRIALSLDVTFFGDRPEAGEVEQVLRHCLTAAMTLRPVSGISARAWHRPSADEQDREPLVLPDGSDRLQFSAKDKEIRASAGRNKAAQAGAEPQEIADGLSSIAADAAVVDACPGFSTEQVKALIAAGAEERDHERKDVVAAMRRWSGENDMALTRELRICMSAISKAIIAAGSAAVALPDDLPAAIARGAEVYETGMCAKCHDRDGRGGEKGPDLTDREWLHCDGSVEGIRNVLVTGVSADKLKDKNRPFAMNPATNLIPDDRQIIDLAIYVESLSQR
jgi:mono/diheme cytochrome c family protein